MISIYILDLRLDLLEPGRNPYLYKALYGILMILPQSSAFATLRNRLNSINAISLLTFPPTQSTSNGSRHGVGNSNSKIRRASGMKSPKSRAAASSEDSQLQTLVINFEDLLVHFPAVQERHEKAKK